MTTEFDEERGRLELSHAALAVLTVLASDPTSRSLQDQGVAAPLAELRRAGIVSSHGIHPAVAPLAVVMGRPRVRLRLTASEQGAEHRIRAWVGADLAVVALARHLAGHQPRQEPNETYEIMADTPAMLPSLIAELVGLQPSVDRVVPGTRRVDGRALRALLRRASVATTADTAAVLGAPRDERWTAALTAAVAGTGLRWTLTVSGEKADDPETVDVLDAGRHGLWTAEYEDDGSAVVRATTAPEVQAVLRHLVASRR